MIKGKKFFGFAAIAVMAACSLSSQAFAQDQGCIVLKSVAEVEQEVVNAKGEKSTKLVPAGQGRAGRRSHLDRHG